MKRSEARRIIKQAIARSFAEVRKYSDDQPRDEGGRWTSSGGGVYERLVNGDRTLTPKELVHDTMASLGYSEETYAQSKDLLDAHTIGGKTQDAADAEIAEHISSGDELGKYFSDKASMEEQAWNDKCQHDKEQSERRYQDALEEVQYLVDSGYYSSMDEAKNSPYWPDENSRMYYYVEPKFYRKGDMDGDVLAFSQDENGANMSPATSGDYGYIGSDVSYTLSEMEDMGYRPIAGIASFDVGYSGEAEVLFAKF